MVYANGGYLPDMAGESLRRAPTWECRWIAVHQSMSKLWRGEQTTKILSCLFWRNYSVEMHRNLLFINHDANSLGRRNDIQLINAHVQKYRRIRRCRIYREISCSLPVDELRIVRERKKADSRQSSPCHQASRSAAVESVSIFNIRNIGKSIDPLCSLVSSECDWLSETLDYCETISTHNAWCCG